MRHTHAHRLTTAAVLACAGLASPALAQDAEAPKVVVRSSSSVNLNKDGKSYEIRVEDGVVKAVKINGEAVDEHTYRFDEEGGFIVLKDGDGEPVVIDVPSFKSFGGHAGFAPMPGVPAVPGVDAIEWMDAPDPGEPADAPVAMAWSSQEPPRVMIGITHDEVSGELREKLELGEGEGIYVIEVRKDLPADKAGIKPGDVIIEVDGRRIDNREVLMEIMGEREPGDNLKVLVLRDGEEKKLKLELAPFDPERLGTATQSRTRVFTPSAPGQHRIRINDDDMDLEGLAEIEIEGLEGLGDLEAFGDFDFDFDMEGLPPEAKAELEKALKMARSQANEARARAFTLHRGADGQRRLLELHARNHEEVAREHGEHAELFAREHAEEMRRLEERLAKLHELGENDHLFRAAPGGRAFIIQGDDDRAPRAGGGSGGREALIAEKLGHVAQERDELMARNRELETRVEALERKLEELMKKVERSQ